MTAPNVAEPASITGKTETYSLADTSATVVCNNAASSGLLKRVRTIIVANDDGTNNAAITLSVHSQDDGGGTAYKIAHTITVPADGSLILTGDPLVNLEEDKSIVATASAGGDLDVIVTYDEVD